MAAVRIVDRPADQIEPGFRFGIEQQAGEDNEAMGVHHREGLADAVLREAAVPVADGLAPRSATYRWKSVRRAWRTSCHGTLIIGLTA